MRDKTFNLGIVDVMRVKSNARKLIIGNGVKLDDSLVEDEKFNLKLLDREVKIHSIPNTFCSFSLVVTKFLKSSFALFLVAALQFSFQLSLAS